MIKPTIGRVVWFWPDPNWEGVLAVDQPWKADIVFVHTDNLVNVAGFRHDGEPFKQGTVLLYQDEGPVPKGVHAQWMPYQKGQAAKTETLERQVAGTPGSSAGPGSGG